MEDLISNIFALRIALVLGDDATATQILFAAWMVLIEQVFPRRAAKADGKLTQNGAVGKWKTYPDPTAIEWRESTYRHRSVSMVKQGVTL